MSVSQTLFLHRPFGNNVNLRIVIHTGHHMHWTEPTCINIIVSMYESKAGSIHKMLVFFMCVFCPTTEYTYAAFTIQLSFTTSGVSILPHEPVKSSSMQ
jgi:hypothetical protein